MRTEPIDPTERESELEGLVRLVGNVSDAFTAALFLPEADGVLRLAACSSLSEHLVSDCELSVGQGLVGWVAENERPLRVSPFRHDARTLQFYDHPEEIKTFLAVPVPIGARAGVLAIDSKRTYEFAPRTEAILTGFAEEIGRRVARQDAFRRALDGAPPLDEVGDYVAALAAAPDLERLRDLAVDVPLSVVPHRAALLLWADRARDALAVVRASGLDVSDWLGLEAAETSSFVGWVERRGTMLYVADVEAMKRRPVLVRPDEPPLAFRSFLGVPLEAGGRVHGVLAFVRDEPIDVRRQGADVLGIVAASLAGQLAAAGQRRVLDQSVGGSPRAVVRYGRFLEEVGAWLAAGEPVEVLVLDPSELRRRNRQHGYRVVDRLLDDALAVVERVLDPAPLITRVAADTWAVAWRVDAARPPGTTARMLERTLREKVFAVDDLETAFPVRVADERSDPGTRDAEALVERAAARLRAASDRA